MATQILSDTAYRPVRQREKTVAVQTERGDNSPAAANAKDARRFVVTNRRNFVDLKRALPLVEQVWIRQRGIDAAGVVAASATRQEIQETRDAAMVVVMRQCRID